MIVDANEIDYITEVTDSDVERIDSVYDGFIGQYPTEKLVTQIVESELTHPAGFGTLLDIQESASELTREWVEENLPTADEPETTEGKQFLEENRSHLVEKISEPFYLTVCEQAEKLYKQCIREWVAVPPDTRFSRAIDTAQENRQPSLDEARELMRKVQ